MPAAWREVALRTSDTCCFRHDMQIGAESNLNSPKPRVCAIHQLPFRASALSTVVRRRVSKTEHESFSLAQEKQRCARLNLCAVSRILSAMMSATGSTADASLLRKRSSDVLDRNSLLLSKCVHSDQRTRRCDRMACYSVQLLLRVMTVCSWYQKNVRSHHTAPQEVGLGSGRASA